MLAGLVLAAGVGLVYSLASGGSGLVRPPRLQRGARLLLFGDSLAVGLGPQFKTLAEEEGVEVRVLAKVSTRIDQWASSAALDAMLAEYEPDMVLVSLGTNDEYMTGDAPARQAPYLDTLLAKLHDCCGRPGPYRGDYGLGAEVVWIMPPELPRETNGIRALIASRLASSERAWSFPSETLEIPRGPDHLHPTAAGYAGWAGAIWEWLS